MSSGGLDLLREFVSIPGPVGQEEAVAAAVLVALGDGFEGVRRDGSGNVLVGNSRSVLVTAHLDEIGMMVKRIGADGMIEVVPLGGMRPWKLGEGPVQILSREPVDGIFGFGSVHTTDPSAASVRFLESAVDWSGARVLTGLSRLELLERGVLPGTRVVVHPCRRGLFEFGDLVGGYFLDDRADLAAWVLSLQGAGLQGATWAATTAEEVGGLGALAASDGVWDVALALELGPVVPDCDVELSSVPTVWVNDGYAPMRASDIELVAGVGKDLGMELQFQCLSRGGSDASILASQGRCRRPITLGIPMENTHGFEVIHRDGIGRLAELVVALVPELVRTTLSP